MTLIKVSLNIRSDQFEKFRELAFYERSTISALVRQAIDEFLAKKEKNVLKEK